ncbi:2-phospho-L-lactate transferase CofD family protein [Nonomuraea ferruginea]
MRRILTDLRATVSLNPEAGDAIRNADLLLYGPGTPHSSLLPSYLTPGAADAIAESRAAAKVFVVNTRDDHDVQGLSAPELVGRTLSYLGDPGNERGTVTHVLSHRAPDAPGVPSDVVAGGVWAGARWVTADLADADRPGVHCGPPHRTRPDGHRRRGRPDEDPMTPADGRRGYEDPISPTADGWLRREGPAAGGRLGRKGPMSPADG